MCIIFIIRKNVFCFKKWWGRLGIFSSPFLESKTEVQSIIHLFTHSFTHSLIYSQTLLETHSYLGSVLSALGRPESYPSLSSEAIEPIASPYSAFDKGL